MDVIPAKIMGNFQFFFNFSGKKFQWNVWIIQQQFEDI